MLKIKNLRQEGTYTVKGKDGQADEVYFLEILHSEAKELYNFYKEKELVSSVFREYKTNYVVETSIYGDEDVFSKYEKHMLAIKFLKTYKTTDTKELCEMGIRRYIEETTINPNKIKSKSEVSLEEIIQKTTYIENTKVNFFIENKDFMIDVKCKEYNYKRKILPIVGLEYKEVTSTVRMKESVTMANIKSLAQVSLEIDTTWLENKRYYVIQTMEQFQKIVDFLRKYDLPIAVDTETTGLRINRLPLNHPDRDNLTGICISWNEDEGYYIPVRQNRFDNLPEQTVMRKLRFILENKHIVTHYGIFDWKVFWGYGINLNILDDTYTLQFMIDAKGSKACKKLKQMTRNYFGVEQIELENFFPKVGKRKQRISFADLPIEAVQAYGPADTDFTLKLYNLLRPKLPKKMEYIYGQEIVLIRNIAYTEYYGIRIDLNALKKETEKTIAEIADLEQKIYREACKGLKLQVPPDDFKFVSYKLHKAEKTDTPESLLMRGIGFNISSSKQLIDVLYDKMGVKKLAYTKKKGGEQSDTPSTSMKTFALYKDITNPDGSPKYPIMVLITKYKKAEKLLTAFFNKLYTDMLYLDYENPKDERKIGFIFPKYNPAGAESGRIAGYAPNLQQTAGSIRALFIADSADHYLIDCDYSQIEYRVMASISRQEDLMETFRDPDVDFHTVMAARLFGIPEEEVTPDKRKQSKALNFGIPYGMGDYSLAVQLYGKATEEAIADAGAKKLTYLDSVPNLRDFFTQTKDYVMIKGYVETMFGRRRQFPDVFGEDKRRVEAAKRQAGNTRIQGTAADIMKIAYNRVCEVLKNMKYTFQTTVDSEGNVIPKDPIYRVAGSIHDELLCVASKKLNPWVIINIMRTCMEIKLPNFAPLYIGATVGNNWADGKDARHELPIPMIDMYLDELNNKGMHTEPLENPERDVYNAIYKYTNDLLYASFEKLGIRKSEKVNLGYAVKVTTDKNTLGLITKYYGIKDAVDPKKFDVNKSIENCLKALFGEDMVYWDNDEAEQIYYEFERFNEHEEFAELLQDNDGALDEDMDEYHEEQIQIDYNALNKEAIKAGTLKIETIKFADARDTYMTTQRIMVLQGDCYINVDGLTESTIDKLVSYLKSVNKASGAYTVKLELNKQFVNTGIKIPVIDRKKLSQILESKNINIAIN